MKIPRKLVQEWIDRLEMEAEWSGDPALTVARDMRLFITPPLDLTGLGGLGSHRE